MRPTVNFFAMFMLIFPKISSLAFPVHDRAIVPAIQSVRELSLRTSNTCADPSLTRTVHQAFSGTDTLHGLQFHYAFVNVDSAQGPGPAFWTFQGAVFKAWSTQQPFTVPLFRLATPTDTDFVFMVGADAQTPPVVGGFKTSAIIAWVYDTAVCGSVPLMSAVLAAQTDHYYTTDVDEHAGLLVAGWTDGGVVAFVLPLPTA